MWSAVLTVGVARVLVDSAWAASKSKERREDESAAVLWCLTSPVFWCPRNTSVLARDRLVAVSTLRMITHMAFQWVPCRSVGVSFLFYTWFCVQPQWKWPVFMLINLPKAWHSVYKSLMLLVYKFTVSFLFLISVNWYIKTEKTLTSSTLYRQSCLNLFAKAVLSFISANKWLALNPIRAVCPYRHQ